MMIQDHRSTTHSTAGFTLLELLLSIAIIFVLIAIVLVALHAAHAAAERAASLNALRQMTSAYTQYSQQHDGRLLPGYIDPADLPPSPTAKLDIKARLKTGVDLAAGDTSSYVWRLSPYLDHGWHALMSDYRDQQLVERLDAEYADGSAAGAYGPATATGNQLGIARVPSFGLNSIFLGGDSFHGPEPNNAPWRGGKKPFVAARMSEVLNPSKIIVFAANKAENVPLPNPTLTHTVLGYCEIRAPIAYDLAGAPVAQWSVDTVNGSPTIGQIIYAGGGPGGVPFARLRDDKVPISHLDGHVETETIGRLALDMSRWAPNALSSQ